MHASDDPLDAVLRPPADETVEQAAVREAREAEARRVSAAIDADIKAERQARRKKRIVRLLLLGQSESGKSTTLRQFQRLYTPTAFREERILWRAVIQLNVVRSIRTILETLEPSSSNNPSSRAPSRPRTRRPSAASASMLALASPTSPSACASNNNYNAHAGPSSPTSPHYNHNPGPSSSNNNNGANANADPYDAGYDSPGYASPGVDSDVESDPGGDSLPVFRNGDYGGGASGGGGALAYHHQMQQQMSQQARAPPIPTASPPPGLIGLQPGNTISWEALKLALLPLRHVEALLIARLVPTAAGEEEPAYLPGSTLAATSMGGVGAGGGGYSLGRGEGGWGGLRVFLNSCPFLPQNHLPSSSLHTLRSLHPFRLPLPLSLCGQCAP
ncbi:G-protein alpha subunit-domain-containing protein [Mycena metata]|uniref:G-protein alpha subunit-domain-containing protein n=1 Tax=Mycena metata TaxID=1033252 RepID=A0AAD7JU95_9AGAR|nr:G-protein alpha subunit-domain-containing protein [Mycena metata]